MAAKGNGFRRSPLSFLSGLEYLIDLETDFVNNGEIMLKFTASLIEKKERQSAYRISEYAETIRKNNGVS